MDVYAQARGDIATPIPLKLSGKAKQSDGFETFDQLLKGEDLLPEVAIGPMDPMSIIYTGGSTSMPKGVLAPHMYYLGAALRYQDITQATADDVHFANSHFFPCRRPTVRL